MHFVSVQGVGDTLSSICSSCRSRFVHVSVIVYVVKESDVCLGSLSRVRQCTCQTLRYLRKAQRHTRDQDSAGGFRHQAFHGHLDVGH